MNGALVLQELHRVYWFCTRDYASIEKICWWRIILTRKAREEAEAESALSAAGGSFRCRSACPFAASRASPTSLRSIGRSNGSRVVECAPALVQLGDGRAYGSRAVMHDNDGRRRVGANGSGQRLIMKADGSVALLLSITVPELQDIMF